MISDTSLLNLAKYYARRYSCFDVLLVLSLIPSMLAGQNRPAVTFHWEAFSAAGAACAERVERAVHAELSKRAGKMLDVVEIVGDIRSQAIRGPYRIDSEDGAISVH